MRLTPVFACLSVANNLSELDLVVFPLVVAVPLLLIVPYIEQHPLLAVGAIARPPFFTSLSLADRPLVVAKSHFLISGFFIKLG